MDSDLIRFRIDPAVREKAMQACADAGLNLNDVLRAFVTRIAATGALPFDDARQSTTVESAAPAFRRYEQGLWASIKPQVDAEAALAVLSLLIARYSAMINEAEDSGDTVARSSAASLHQQRQAVIRIRQELDVTDQDAVRLVLATHRPLLESLSS